MGPDQTQQQNGQQTNPSPLAQIGSILPAVLTGLGAMATTNRWSGPGAAWGRGAMAGVGAYEAMKPKPQTAQDRLFDEKAKTLAVSREQTQKLLQDRDSFMKNELNETERGMVAMGQEKLAIQSYFARTNEDTSNALLKQFGMDDDFIKTADPLSKFQLSSSLMQKQAKGMNLQVLRDYVGPDGKPAYGVFDRNSNRIIQVLPKAQETAGSKDPVTQAAMLGAQLKDRGVPEDQWPPSALDAYKTRYHVPRPTEEKLGPPGLAAMRQAYDSRMMVAPKDPEARKRLADMPFEDFIKESMEAARKAQEAIKKSSGGVTPQSGEEVWTDGQTIFRGKGVNLTPEEAKNLGLTRVQ